MSPEFAFWIRVIMIPLGMTAFILQLIFMVQNGKRMSGSQYMKGWAFSGLIFASIWGVSESLFKDIPAGPRTFILFVTVLWAFIAEIMPSKYQQFYDEEKK